MSPELYTVGGTPYVPGSHLPIIVYRRALSECENEDAMKDALEANGGWKKGGAWNSFFRAHYHPNIHECYGVVSGSSELSLGRGPLDDPSKGILLKVSRGDVVILPAGISHCSSTASPDYRFVVMFPTVSFELPRKSRRCQFINNHIRANRTGLVFGVTSQKTEHPSIRNNVSRYRYRATTLFMDQVDIL
ncbi:unnamed protein product [Clonostachys rosea]|uniref:Cupin type-1 domain-containing protein n=1 Tax=Bionectria ochroleuca TaxID=29856 RepID=A0ABY6UFF8_BIOOC|nr:unnamed protein product [Clonostachys rosea]